MNESPAVPAPDGNPGDAPHGASASGVTLAEPQNPAATQQAVDAPPTAPVSAPAGVEENPAVAAEGEIALESATPAEPAPVEHGIGVLLVNLGTPDAPDAPAVRRYLKEFLSDRRVVEKDSLLWKLLLNGIILPLRPRRRARDYQKIWNRQTNESPIKTITRSQAEKLSGTLEPLGRHVVVDWAMRYANPSIASRLEALIKRGCDRILVMPLYPQYAAATTATACDEVYRFMMKLRHQPALRILPAYY
jgi:protoporphyrin/coproporphyrin ferrochelatase